MGNTGKVTDMQGMFRACEVFNHDISGWDTSKVTTMVNMFRNAKIFNQDLSSWNTGNVNNVFRLFYDAKEFNQDLCGWAPTLAGYVKGNDKKEVFKSTNCPTKDTASKTFFCHSC